ncbi:MAG: M20 family metallopeptidase [Acidobacteria bacterium]|nr:M20 family metallopeptidase [Acidobacteriota bacterium]
MTPDELLTWCRADEPWLLETLEALVRLESPSTSKTAVDRCGVELALRLEAIGARVDRLPQAARGDHLRAEFPGTAGGRPVLILGHFDTVWDVGELARMPIREEGGRLHGPGIFDMKAGIAVAMQAMRALAAAGGPPRPDVVMLWTTDEEIGSATSRGIIEEEARRSAAVLVLEPSLPGGAAKTARKGCGDFELTVRGVSAHAGIDPGGGASAIHEMARQVSALERLRDIDPAVSVNVGLIRGGTRPNVVADEAHASIDVRAPTMAAAARVEDAVRGLVPTLRGTTLEITGGFGRPPLERTSQVMRLYEVARDAARELGVELGEGSTGGGSDGNFTAALGVPTLDGLGPMGDGAHARHEHVLRQDLCWRAAFVGLLLTRLAR